MRKPSSLILPLAAPAVAMTLAGCFGRASDTNAHEVNFDASFDDVTLQADGSDDAPLAPETAVESGGMDASVSPDVFSADAGRDATIDAPAEASAHDATAEAAADAGVDAAAEVGVDAAPDVGVDAAVDAVAEAGVDAVADVAVVDASIDAPVDSGTVSDGNTCGDNVITGGQVCNGTDLGGKTCTSLLGAGVTGTLGCAADCASFDVSKCVCATGYTACASPTGCFDLVNDKNHCGSCTATCGPASACTVGNCTTVLNQSSPQATVVSIALDANNLYYSNTFNGKVYSVPLAGGTPTPLTATPPATTSDFVTSTGTEVYWTVHSPPAVYKVPVGGGAVVTVSSTEVYPQQIVNDGTDVFWANGMVLSGSLVQDVIATDTVSTLPITPDAGPGLSQIVSLAIDANHVYWGDVAGGTGTGALYQANRDGTNVIPLALGIDSVYGIAVDATNVYFTNYPDNTVNAVPIGGGAVTLLASGEDSPTQLTTDGVSLYWLNIGYTQAVRKKPIAGGPVTTLSTCNYYLKQVGTCGSLLYSQILVDSNFVYWNDSTTVSPGGSGGVFRVPK